MQFLIIHNYAHINYKKWLSLLYMYTSKIN